jgi:NTE family protein
MPMLLASLIRGSSGDDGTTGHGPERHRAKRRRPVIGLALGGGAARGWAHIGVLRAMDRAGFRPDVIAGTSIGAVVGGSYAAGLLDEIEAFARSLTRRSVLGLMDFHIPSSGLIAGGRLRRQLESKFAGRQIEDMGTRFAAIATELGAGNEVWLTHGSASDAIRASYALPGIFEPVKLGGRWLVDGALTNPVPVSVARALGAEVVIAVNLHADVFGRSHVVSNHGAEKADAATSDAPPGFFTPLWNAASALRHPFGGSDPEPDSPGIGTVILDAFNISQDRLARSRLAGDPPDIMLAPKLGRIGLGEFHRADEIIALGQLTAERALADLEDAVEAA